MYNTLGGGITKKECTDISRESPHGVGANMLNYNIDMSLKFQTNTPYPS